MQTNHIIHTNNSQILHRRILFQTSNKLLHIYLVKNSNKIFKIINLSNININDMFVNSRMNMNHMNYSKVRYTNIVSKSNFLKYI